MRCDRHPDAETSLSCGRCGTPICPRCLVQTPVGARCPKCAGSKQLPTYAITPRQYFKATGAGLVLAIILGIVWTILWDIIPFFSLLLAAGVGYAMGELISLSVNRKRGRWLQVIGVSSVTLCYMVVKYSPWGMVFSFWDILVLAVAIFLVVSRLR